VPWLIVADYQRLTSITYFKGFGIRHPVLPAATVQQIVNEG
jgi:hypothetical protein